MRDLAGTYMTAYGKQEGTKYTTRRHNTLPNLNPKALHILTPLFGYTRALQARR